MNGTPGPAPLQRNGEQWFDVAGQRYPVQELKNVRVMHAAHSDLTTISTLAGLAIVIAIARLWEHLDRNGWAGALVLLSVPALLTVLGLLLRRPSRVLVADHGGRTTLLLDDKDRRQFDRAVKSLRRATKANRH